MEKFKTVAALTRLVVAACCRVVDPAAGEGLPQQVLTAVGTYRKNPTAKNKKKCLRLGDRAFEAFLALPDVGEYKDYPTHVVGYTLWAVAGAVKTALADSIEVARYEARHTIERVAYAVAYAAGNNSRDVEVIADSTQEDIYRDWDINL